MDLPTYFIQLLKFGVNTSLRSSQQKKKKNAFVDRVVLIYNSTLTLFSYYKIKHKAFLGAEFYSFSYYNELTLAWEPYGDDGSFDDLTYL